jgi:hypothetical protein
VGSTGELRTELFAGPFSAVNDTCNGASLKRNESCIIDVVYTPTALGPQRGFLFVVDTRFEKHSREGDVEVDLRGTGT